MYELSRDRFKELKHFCLQYPEWKERYAELDGKIGKPKEDVTAYAGVTRADYIRVMSLIEMTAALTDPTYYDYLMKAVTNNCSLSSLGLPCDEDVFEVSLHRFYWRLSQVKGL